MRRCIVFQLGWVSAALLAGAGTAVAQTPPGKQSGPPAFNWGKAPIQNRSTSGGPTTAGSGRPLNIGLGSPGNVAGGTSAGAVAGTQGRGFGNTAGFGGASGLGGFRGSAGFGQLLSPEQELMVLFDAIATAEAVIDELGLQFNNSLELLFFFLMIYEAKYQEAVQGLVGGTTDIRTGGAP